MSPSVNVPARTAAAQLQHAEMPGGKQPAELGRQPFVDTFQLRDPQR